MDTGKAIVSSIIARFVKARSVDRIFGLCGGHIMPVWMAVQAEAIRIAWLPDLQAVSTWNEAQRQWRMVE